MCGGSIPCGITLVRQQNDPNRMEHIWQSCTAILDQNQRQFYKIYLLVSLI